MNETFSIDPTVSAVVNVLMTLVGVGAGSTAEFTTLLGQGPAQKIVAGFGLAMALLSAFNTWLHSYSAPVAGPAVSNG